MFDQMSSQVETESQLMPAQKGDRRESAIVETAQKRFSHYGYSKTTMEEIARDLGMGKASLYYYFPTKESLFSAVIAAGLEELSVFATHLLAGQGRASDKIRAYAERRLDYFRKTLILSRLDLQTYSKIRPTFSKTMQDFAKREHEILRAMLESGTREGEFVLDDPERVAGVLLRVLRGLRILLFKSSSPEEPSQKDLNTLRQDTQFVTETFLRAIQAHPVHSSTPATEGNPD